MDVDDFILLTILPFLSGPIIFVTDSLLPVIPIILGLGTIRGKGCSWGIFLGFIASFTFFRLFISLMVKLSEISFDSLQYIGLFFLALFGIMMIFPQFSLWNKVEKNFIKGIIYGALLGFIWSFWVGLSKAVFADYYEPKWIGFIEIYLALLSGVLPGIILVCVHFILSKIYPSKYIPQIERILGYFTLFLVLILTFHLVKITTPREGLKPEEPPPIPLYQIFHLPKR